EGHVVQEGVAAVQEPAQPARGHVPPQAAALLEVERAPRVRAPGQRGDGEHALEEVGTRRRLHVCTLAVGAGPVVPRGTKKVGTITGGPASSPPSRLPSRAEVAPRASSSRGRHTVERGGSARLANAMSSNPTTERSRGMA